MFTLFKEASLLVFAFELEIILFISAERVLSTVCYSTSDFTIFDLLHKTLYKPVMNQEFDSTFILKQY